MTPMSPGLFRAHRTTDVGGRKPRYSRRPSFGVRSALIGSELLFLISGDLAFFACYARDLVRRGQKSHSLDSPTDGHPDWRGPGIGGCRNCRP